MKKIQTSILLITLGTGLLSACNIPSQTQPQLSQTVESSSSRVNFDEYIGKFVDFADTTDKTTRTALTNKLGEPISSSEIAQENIHNPAQTDLIETMQYKELAITLYKIGDNEGKVIISEMLFSGPNYALKGGIKVGDSLSAVIQLLGAPEQSMMDPDSEETIAIYCDSFTGQSCLNFYHQNSSIKKIVYQSYLD